MKNNVEEMNKTEMISTIYDTLLDMAEPAYKQFSSKLLPGVENILGVRLPKLRKFAKRIWKVYGTLYLEEVLEKTYFNMDKSDTDRYRSETMEEILLQGMIIGNLKVSEKISIMQIQNYVRSYVPKINNWSTCDSFCAGLKIAKEYPEQMWKFILEYLNSKRDFDVRFGLVMIINYYIQESYLEKLFFIFSQIGKEWNINNQAIKAQDIYYVQMALAWAISICYVQYPDRTSAYLDKMRTEILVLDDFTYHKTLQKITESHCVSQEKKKEIKLMKRMNS